MGPVEPAASAWRFPPDLPEGTDLAALGGDLEPGTLLTAYRRGFFPMPVPEMGGVIGWFSPNPRAVLPLDGFRESRTLRSSRRRFRVTVDSSFSETIRRCADPRRPLGWITEDLITAYEELHALGWAHSVEVWTPEGVHAGGLYGVAIGGLFAGESMWHDPRPLGRDASKVALAWLVDTLSSLPGAQRRLLDVQWATPHLTRLGAVELPRATYLELLQEALEVPHMALPTEG